MRQALTWLKTATAITLWNGEKTYMVGVDDPQYKDVITQIDNGGDWYDVMTLIDPSVNELEDDELD